jgi:hypothetical protein
MRICVIAFAVVALTLEGSGCSSSGSAGSVAGISDGTALTSLTASQRNALCDSTASAWGGYGKTSTVKCDGGSSSVSGPTSQASCASQLAGIPSSCGATVGDLSACEGATPQTASCSSNLSVPAACVPILECEFSSFADAG